MDEREPRSPEELDAAGYDADNSLGIRVANLIEEWRIEDDLAEEAVDNLIGTQDT